MAWKKVYENDNAGVKGDGIIPRGQWTDVPVSGLAGKRVRVTVEEEVSECCERWRGLRNVYEIAGCEPLLSDYQATFCPECGRRL